MIVDSAGAQDAEHMVGAACRVRAGWDVGERNARDPRVLVHRVADTREQVLELLAPAPRVRLLAQIHFAYHRVEHLVQQVLPVLDIHVKRRRTGVELCGNAPHRDGVDSFLAQHA